MFRQLSSACLVTRTGGRSNLSSVPRPRHGPGRASGQRRGGVVQQPALPALHPRARPEDSAPHDHYLPLSPRPGDRKRDGAWDPLCDLRRRLGALCVYL